MINKELNQYAKEIQRNLHHWKQKPILQTIYNDFYSLISKNIDYSLNGSVVELGSGIGNIKMAIPDAICTDLFSNPWIDQVENAYRLSFKDGSVSNLILFDVFHHLEYPGNALAEFHRVLAHNGRVIIFDPAISLTGLVAYGLFHPEPLALFRKISWHAPSDFDPWLSGYYAGQGNAERIFFGNRYKKHLRSWNILKRQKYSSFTYLLSGGYSKPKLFPSTFYRYLKTLEKRMDSIPLLFGTRALIVLQKYVSYVSGSVS